MRRQPAWMREIKVGDLLQRRDEPPRAVRGVSHYSNGDLHYVTFAIRHCSWTHRCTTTMNYNDLRYFGYRPTGQRVELDKEIDRAIAHCVQNHRRDQQTLDCCDVKGVL